MVLIILSLPQVLLLPNKKLQDLQFGNSKRKKEREKLLANEKRFRALLNTAWTALHCLLKMDL
jgi:hypothetical protein